MVTPTNKGYLTNGETPYMHGDTPQWEAPQILAVPEQVLIYKEKDKEIVQTITGP